MPSQNKFYITTTLPYVNADPHIGFAAEIVRADVLARFARLCGREVFFNTGTDEHGLKIFRKAAEEGMGAQACVDKYAARFDKLRIALNLSYDSFTRTTGEHHVKAAQEFWRRCDAAGDIYKKNYKVKYCVGCEAAKTESELKDNECPLHPGQPLETIDEENYFFRWSKYQDKLLAFYDANPDFVVPPNRLKEIRNFVAAGLEDFSISRLKAKMPWGVPVPGDGEHVMYVWFDALSNYISCLGWPEDETKFKGFWGTADERNALQVAGKDNLRFQAAMWQAMLMSAGLPNSKQVLIFGFITSGGKKMSKSLGNTVNPMDLTEKYGTDAVRYFLLSELKPFEDGDYTEDKFIVRYTADLANGIGNLVARTISMTEKYFSARVPTDKEQSLATISPEYLFGVLTKQESWPVCEVINQEVIGYQHNMRRAAIDESLAKISRSVKILDNYISEYEPFKLIREDINLTAGVLYNCLESLRIIGLMLMPYLPDTAAAIWRKLGLDPAEELKTDFEHLKRWGRLKPGLPVKKGESLFPRILPPKEKIDPKAGQS